MDGGGREGSAALSAREARARACACVAARDGAARVAVYMLVLVLSFMQGSFVKGVVLSFELDQLSYSYLAMLSQQYLRGEEVGGEDGERRGAWKEEGRRMGGGWKGIGQAGAPCAAPARRRRKRALPHRSQPRPASAAPSPSPPPRGQTSRAHARLAQA
jgi:hypothetical protein